MENKDFTRLIRILFKRGIRSFAANYMTAVKNGADVAEQEIIKTFENRDQPADRVKGKLFEAVKKGVQHASEQMVESGADIVEQMKTKPRKK